MRTFYIKTLGCKVNQFEAEVLATDLLSRGWQAAQDGEPADVCIINTCTVTGRAAMQSRQEVRRCRREHPDAFVVAIGCYAAVGADELDATEAVDCIVHQAAKGDLPALLAQAAAGGASLPSRVFPEQTPTVFRRLPDAFPHDISGNQSIDRDFFKTRSFLKIQDGCNAFCTYCIVPYTRGRSVSLPPDDVLAAMKSLSAAGHREVVLTGIHLGAYGRDLSPATSLYELLEEIIAVRPVDRVRLSSIEPGELNTRLIDLAAASEVVCNHFHIPLQSGSDNILKKMGRPYAVSFFADRVTTIKTKIPDAAIGADILVGFPGESEADFVDTCRVIKDLPISYLHVFPFSPRPGTPAYDYADHVHSAVIKDRCRILRQIGQEKNKVFCNENQGAIAEMLIESRRDGKSGYLKGVTSNYLTVFVPGDDNLMTDIVPVCIQGRREGLSVDGALV